MTVQEWGSEPERPRIPRSQLPKPSLGVSPDLGLPGKEVCGWHRIGAQSMK